jgi:hypothetical protein
MTHVFPTVHLNGTSKTELLDQLGDAIDLLHDAGRALAKATPNGRDYYLQRPEGAINVAMAQHESRMSRLRSVINELEEILWHVDRQGNRS